MTQVNTRYWSAVQDLVEVIESELKGSIGDVMSDLKKDITEELKRNK